MSKFSVCVLDKVLIFFWHVFKWQAMRVQSHVMMSAWLIYLGTTYRMLLSSSYQYACRNLHLACLLTFQMRLQNNLYFGAGQEQSLWQP
jgi:hypothetical protein